MKARLIHAVGDVQTRESEVLECPSDAVVEGAIGGSVAVLGRQLGRDVDWRGCRLTICHPSTFQNVFGVLGLVEVEASSVTAHLDAKEKMQLTEILDRERFPELINNVAQ